MAICPGAASKETFRLIDLYNLIDMHILEQEGFYSFYKGERCFITTSQLKGASQMLKLLTILLHTIDYYKLRQNKQKEYKQYKGFAAYLAKWMQKEGLRKQKEDLTDRSFYLFSYALVSMNWEPMLLWMLFMAHYDANKNNPPYVGNPSQPLKLFHDMAILMGVREIGTQPLTPRVWYPFNETVVQRLNDSEHVTSRRVRVGNSTFLMDL